MAQSTKIKQLHQIISALERFETQKNSLFSLDKLTNYLSLSEGDLEEVLELVFRFQNLFSFLIPEFILCKKWRDNKRYLFLKSISEVSSREHFVLKEVEINQSQVNLLSDITYYFHHIKIGMGFDVKRKGPDLLMKVKQLNRSHPFFFERKGNGLLYPSKLAVEAGNLIQSYNRSKKTLTKLEIGDFLIQIV
jgi:uncharacterized protein (UPF0335 family)